MQKFVRLFWQANVILSPWIELDSFYSSMIFCCHFSVCHCGLVWWVDDDPFDCTHVDELEAYDDPSLMQFRSERFSYIKHRINMSAMITVAQWRDPRSLTSFEKKNHWLKVLSEFLAMEITLDEIIPDIPKQEVIDPTDGFTNQVIMVWKKTACHTLTSQLFWKPMITGHWSLLILVITVHTVRSVPKNRRQSQIGK